MNFSPNIQNYDDLRDAINNTQAHINDVASVKFTIDSDDEDVDGQLSGIENDVDKACSRANTEAAKILNELNCLIATDYHCAADNFCNFAKMCSSLGKAEEFFDEVYAFPFNEWFGIEGFDISIYHLKNFFENLPVKEEDLTLYYYNLEHALQDVKSVKPKIACEIFKLSLGFFDDVPKKENFLQDIFKSTDYKNTFVLAGINQQLDSKHYDLDAIVPDYKEFLKDQFAEGSARLIEIIFDNQVHQKTYLNRDKSGQVTYVYWDNLKTLVDLDFEFGTNFREKMLERIEKISPLKSNQNTHDLEFQSFKSYILQKKLNSDLDDKCEVKKMKI